MAGLTVLWRVEPEGRRYRWRCGPCPATGTAGTQHEAEQHATGHTNREHGEVGR